ncbi:MAG: hypothetical protein JRM99_03190 [Nitrososphaerota archaeon]|nr:hypothetical protein [Nitrososphaerota archaeon]MDG6979686.1 hypothetical protein [Nitrososphaerota archaeon]MDG6990410.1 hypothetical protein [Nitrososphaerota archaeon]
MTPRSSTASILLLALAISLATQGAVAQTSYTLTVSTDEPSYISGQTIQITGKVAPPPGPNTAVFLEIINPRGTVVAPGEAPVGTSTGLYNFTLVAGGTSAWVAGTYTVNATWGAYSPQVSAMATFQYATSVVTSTSSSTSSSENTTSSQSITTTTSTSSSSTVSTSNSANGGGIPEFPFQAAMAGIFVLVVVSAYLVMKKAPSGAHLSHR